MNILQENNFEWIPPERRKLKSLNKYKTKLITEIKQDIRVKIEVGTRILNKEKSVVLTDKEWSEGEHM